MRKQLIFAALAATALVIAATSTQLPAGAHGHDEKSDTDQSKAAPGHDAHAVEVKLSDAAVRQNPIRVGPAEMKDLAAGFTASGRVSFNADAVAHVGPAVGGRVVEIKARVGDAVKRDDELLVIESAEFGRSQSDFLQRRVEDDVAAAAVAPLNDAYDRAKKLFDESQGIALPEVQKREADYRAAVGQAATGKAARQAAENGLRLFGVGDERLKTLVETGRADPRCVVRSPIDGTLVERRVVLGEWVSPEKERPLVVADTRSLWVVAEVPEARLAEIGIGSAADVRLAALPGELITGTVALVMPEVDAHTRTAGVRIVVPNPAGRLRPGMFASVRLQGRSAGVAGVVVPEEAVQTVEGKPSVFVPVDGEPNTFTPRPVTTGKPVDGYVAVTSGLKAGEAVVVSGSFILKAELGKSEAGHEH